MCDTFSTVTKTYLKGEGFKSQEGLRDQSARVRVQTPKSTQLLGQTPFQAPDIRAPSPPEERSPPGRALPEQVEEPTWVPDPSETSLCR